MKKVFSFGFLCLFLFSTVTTFASAHLCEGELTDIAVLSLASCDHEQELESKHSDSCCKKEEKCEEEDDDCCDTVELTSVKQLLISAVAVDAPLISKILPSFYDFYFEHHKVLRKTYGIAWSPPPNFNRDILIEVQCFRI